MARRAHAFLQASVGCGFSVAAMAAYGATPPLYAASAEDGCSCFADLHHHATSHSTRHCVVGLSFILVTGLLHGDGDLSQHHRYGAFTPLPAAFTPEATG